MRVATLAGVAALSLIATGGAQAAFPASKSRLLMVSEDFVFALPVLVRENGEHVPIGLPLGVHGTAAMSPDGTRIAMVETIALFPELNAPACSPARCSAT